MFVIVLKKNYSCSAPFVSERRDRGVWRARAAGPERATAGDPRHRGHPLQSVRDYFGKRGSSLVEMNYIIQSIVVIIIK